MCCATEWFHRLYIVDGVDLEALLRYSRILYNLFLSLSHSLSFSSVNGGKFNRLRNWNRESLSGKSEEESPPDQFQYPLGQNRIFSWARRERERGEGRRSGVDGGPGHIHTEREKEETVIEKVWAPSSTCSNTIFSQEKFFQGAQKIVGEAQHFPC